MVRGQGLAFTFGTHGALSTHLVDCMYYMWSWQTFWSCDLVITHDYEWPETKFQGNRPNGPREDDF